MNDRDKGICLHLRALAEEFATEAIKSAATEEQKETIRRRLAAYEPILRM